MSYRQYHWQSKAHKFVHPIKTLQFHFPFLMLSFINKRTKQRVDQFINHKENNKHKRKQLWSINSNHFICNILKIDFICNSSIFRSIRSLELVGIALSHPQTKKHQHTLLQL